MIVTSEYVWPNETESDQIGEGRLAVATMERATFLLTIHS